MRYTFEVTSIKDKRGRKSFTYTETVDADSRIEAVRKCNKKVYHEPLWRQVGNDVLPLRTMKKIRFIRVWPEKTEDQDGLVRFTVDGQDYYVEANTCA